jgi:hypothetical protein
VHYDWEKSHKLDLSDEGLIHDLKERSGELDKLVLNKELKKKG